MTTTDNSSSPQSTNTNVSTSYIIISNIALIFWVIFLAVIGTQAVNKNASSMILGFPENLVDFFKKSPASSNTPPQSPVILASTTLSQSRLEPDCLDVTKELSKYIKNKYNKYTGPNEVLIPPIATVIDQLQVNVNWRDPSRIKQLTKLENAPTCNDYQILFDIVAKRLEVIAHFSPPVSVGTELKIPNNILPLIFRSKGNEKEKIPEFKELDISLPLEVIVWVQAKQIKNQKITDAISFLNLFVLLIILGGFGSWIYLVRLHLNSSPGKVKLQEYFYRPVLGMALAIAVFIVNLSFHSLVSNSSLDQVRKETLILLAFTAGLLSEQTYEFVEGVAKKHVESEDENKNPPGTK